MCAVFRAATDAARAACDVHRALAETRVSTATGHPLPPGQTISLTGVTITILESAEDGAPVRIRYRFDGPLEAPALRWVRWQDGVYVPFTPPALGATVHLASAVGPFERRGGWSSKTGAAPR